MAWWDDVTSVKNGQRGATVRYAVYPVIANLDVVGVQLTAATAKLMDAVAAAILTAGTSPQVEYWICSVLLHSIGGAAEIHGVELQTAGAVKLWDCIMDVTAKTVNLPPYDLPFPINMAAKAVVNGILGNVTGGTTAYVALLCATLL